MRESLTNYQKLYAKGAHGTRIYEIWSEGRTIVMIANGGRYTEVVTEGKAGRSLEQQIKLRIDARVRSKMDHGFVTDPNNIPDNLTNQLGYVMPMLADHLKNQKNFTDKSVYIQPKLDGHRCLTNSETSYSRGGKVIDTIGNLTEKLAPKGIILDGELYCHGQSLQTISSWAKRYQKNTELLQYHIYDLIVEDELDMPFTERFKLLLQLIDETNRIKIVSTVDTLTTGVVDLFKEFRSQGYEGAIVRTYDSQYQIGKRSKGLLKVKHYEDAEFECIGMTTNQHGWAILHLKTKAGRVFKATAPGTVLEKRMAFLNIEKYIGKWVTVEFANYTAEGIPFQPVATRWREDL